MHIFWVPLIWLLTAVSLASSTVALPILSAQNAQPAGVRLAVVFTFQVGGFDGRPGALDDEIWRTRLAVWSLHASQPPDVAVAFAVPDGASAREAQPWCDAVGRRECAVLRMPPLPWPALGQPCIAGAVQFTRVRSGPWHAATRVAAGCTRDSRGRLLGRTRRARDDGGRHQERLQAARRQLAPLTRTAGTAAL